MSLQDFTAHSAALPWDGKEKHFIAKQIIDCSKSVANGGFGTLLHTDTAKVMEIKEGWLVKRVYVRLIKKGTAASAIDSLGDSLGAGVWMATDFATGTGGTVGAVQGSLIGDTNPALGGYLYLTDNYILLTPKTAAFDGTIEIVAEIVDIFGGLSIS